MSHYVQVGVTAMRDPLTGDFLPSVPLYARKTDIEKASIPETLNLYDIKRVLGMKFREYEEECRKRGLDPT